MNIKQKRTLAIIVGLVVGISIGGGYYANKLSTDPTLGAPTKIDISTQTNLEATSPVVLTNDTLSINLASSALEIDSTASISGAITLGNLISCDTIDSDANGLLSCGTDDSGGGTGMLAHGLLSDEWHNDVSNASASAGALIYGSGTTWTPLAVGASDSFLLSDGTNPIYLADPTVASMSITNLWTSTLTGTLTGDLTCTDCLNATEIEDIYFLTAGDNASASVMTIDSADITSASFGTIYAGTWNGAKIDVSDYTNFTAGTGFDLDGDTLNADFSEFTLDTSLLGGDMIPFWEDTGGDEKKISWTNMQASIDALGTITIVGASVSGEFDIVGDLNVPSASFTNIWATGTITGNLTGAVTGNASTATALAANGANCNAGNYPLGVDASGAVENCTADANTTYTATNPLSLVGTAFAIDVASAGGAGAISVANWETFNEKISSLSIDTSAELITIVGDETGSGVIVFGTSPVLTTSFTTTGVFAINPGGALTIGDGGDTLVITTSDWGIDATGIMTNMGAITTNGLFTGTHASLSGDIDIVGDLNVASVSALAFYGTITGDLTCTDCLNATEIEDIYLLDDGDVGTGAYDFGGASLELPNGTSITLDANGEAGIDTTAGQFNYYSDEVNILMATESFGFAITSTAFDLSTIMIKRPDDPITITAISCICKSATSVNFQLVEGDANGANGAVVDGEIVCAATNTEDDGALSNAAIDAGDWLLASVSQASGECDVLSGTVYFKWTAQ